MTATTIRHPYMAAGMATAAMAITMVTTATLAGPMVAMAPVIATIGPARVAVVTMVIAIAAVAIPAAIYGCRIVVAVIVCTARQQRQSEHSDEGGNQRLAGTNWSRERH